MSKRYCFRFNSNSRMYNTYSVFVGHINRDTTRIRLRDLFQSCGEIVDLVLMDKSNVGTYNIGFVRYATCAAAYRAVSELDGWELGSQRLRVEISKDTAKKIAGEKNGQNKPTETASCSSRPQVPLKTRQSQATQYIADTIYLQRLEEQCIAQNLQHSHIGVLRTTRLLEDIKRRQAERFSLLWGRASNTMNNFHQIADNITKRCRACPEKGEIYGKQKAAEYMASLEKIMRILDIRENIELVGQDEQIARKVAEISRKNGEKTGGNGEITGGNENKSDIALEDTERRNQTGKFSVESGDLTSVVDSAATEKLQMQINDLHVGRTGGEKLTLAIQNNRVPSLTGRMMPGRADLISKDSTKMLQEGTDVFDSNSEMGFSDDETFMKDGKLPKIEFLWGDSKHIRKEREVLKTDTIIQENSSEGGSKTRDKTDVLNGPMNHLKGFREISTSETLHRMNLRENHKEKEALCPIFVEKSNSEVDQKKISKEFEEKTETVEVEGKEMADPAILDYHFSKVNRTHHSQEDDAKSEQSSANSIEKTPSEEDIVQKLYTALVANGSISPSKKEKPSEQETSPQKCQANNEKRQSGVDLVQKLYAALVARGDIRPQALVRSESVESSGSDGSTNGNPVGDSGIETDFLPSSVTKQFTRSDSELQVDWRRNHPSQPSELYTTYDQSKDNRVVGGGGRKRFVPHDHRDKHYPKREPEPFDQDLYVLQNQGRGRGITCIQDLKITVSQSKPVSPPRVRNATPGVRTLGRGLAGIVTGVGRGVGQIGMRKHDST